MDSTVQRSERVIQVDNETSSCATRTSKGGTKYTYRMTVLQQPQRARACGAGAKSSADRRPVDPPPIVELKVFEGDSDKGGKDITYDMKANYFLFATLEQARPMAHGRVGEDKTQRLTVLAGTPVAGMVYLDRPSPAGYFIFPDLSVRHEGKYRLSFSLYEELKEAKDDDTSDPLSRFPTPPPDSVVTHRLEVKSAPFTVFSAKKFPGLTESTSLSRMVAEQGCRVRIRRDVRMRRRDTKSGKEWDDYEDETAATRARVSSAPEGSSTYPTLPPPPGSYTDSMGRPRSASNASHHSLALPVSRRTSLQDMNNTFHQPFSSTGPHTPQSVYAQTSPYGPSPSQQFQQPPYMDQQPPMQPPPPQFSSQPPYQRQQPMSAPVQPPQSFYGYAPAAPPSQLSSSQYPTSPMYDGSMQSHRTSLDYPPVHDHRRASAPYDAPASTQSHFAHQQSSSFSMPTPTHNGYQPAPPPLQQPTYSAQLQHQPSYSSQDSYTSRAPPPQPVQPPARATGANTPLSARSSFDHRLPSQLRPLHVPNDLSSKLEPSPVQPPTADYYFSSASAAADSRKRDHGSVFREPHQYAPMRQGARPTGPYNFGHTFPGSENMYAADEAEDPEPPVRDGARRMQYHRADGRQIIRHLPPHSDE